MIYFTTTDVATIGIATTAVATTDVIKAYESTLCRAQQGGEYMIEISSDVIRGYNDTMILFLLRNEPSYGYDISKQIKTLSDGKYIIKETTLYSAFSRMEKNGYVESYPVEDESTGKKRTYYRITQAGIDYYRKKCEEWELTKEVIELFVLKEN